MHLSARSLMLVVVGGIALFCTACGSNNQGKIVGKWKVVSATGESDNNFKEMEKMKIGLFFDFKDDNTVHMSVDTLEDKPKGKAKTDESAPIFNFTFKYKLLSGDMVEFYDLPKDLQQKGGGGLFGSKDKGREKIKISGDNMSIIEDKINMSLVRVK